MWKYTVPTVETQQVAKEQHVSDMKTQSNYGMHNRSEKPDYFYL